MSPDTTDTRSLFTFSTPSADLIEYDDISMDTSSECSTVEEVLEMLPEKRVPLPFRQ